MSKATKKPDVRDRAKRVMELFGGTEENAGFLKVNFNYDTVADRIAAGNQGSTRGVTEE